MHSVTKMSSVSPLVSSEYGYCFCARCNGSIRTRRTILEHRTHVQKPMGENDRICHCRRHPLGATVHRHTLRNHRNVDTEDIIQGDSLSRETDGIEDLLRDAADEDEALRILRRMRDTILGAQDIMTPPRGTEADAEAEEEEEEAEIDAEVPDDEIHTPLQGEFPESRRKRN